MKESDKHYLLYRYLRSPIIDVGEGTCVSPIGLKVGLGQVGWFKERKLKSFCFDEIEPRQIRPAMDMLADGGILVAVDVAPETIKLLKNDYKYQVIKEPPFIIIRRLSGTGGEVPVLPPKPVGDRKRVLIIRYGAFGDHLMVTPLVEHYFREGWHITYNCTRKGESLFRGDPRIDDLMVQEDDILPALRTGMVEYWNKLGKGYDKVIPLSEVIEGTLLRIEGTKEYHDSPLKRRVDCCKNYIDHHFERAGMPEIKGRLPVIPLSTAEREFAHREVDAVRKKLGKSFIVLWNVFGSSWHKAYPWMFDVWMLLRENRDDIGILAISDQMGKFVVGNEFAGTVYNGCDKYKIRQSLSLHSAVDAVVTPETWSLTAAQGFDAPMIAMMSHSDPRCFTWKDTDIPLTPPVKDCDCFPCFQLHYSREGCPRGTYNSEATLCADSLAPATVYQALMKLRSRHGNHA